MEFREHVPLAPMTTFEIGGAARWYTEVTDLVGLKKALSFARQHDLAVFILGGGSNLLISDSGFNGLVVKIASKDFRIDGTQAFAQAGVNLEELIRQTAEAGLVGWEKMAGIPGSVGGAVRGNAGAFGVEIVDVLESVNVYDTQTDTEQTYDNAACAFAYRTSYFKDKPHLVILDVTLALTVGDKAQSLLEIEDTIQERNRRHLQNVRAAGSFFMNPVVSGDIQKQFQDEKNAVSKGGRVPAGWLIEKAGLKGAAHGGAQASLQHPNYLVNVQAATFDDVQTLATQIQAAVLEKFGVQLHEEVTTVI